MGLWGKIGMAVVLLSLAACGKDGTATAEPPAEAEPSAAEAEATQQPTESPVSEGAHEWPDGITATVVSATASPAVEPDDPAQDTEVRVVVEFGNEGTEVLSFGPSPNTIDAGPNTALLYGANRTEAQGWYFEENNLPTQLTPGTTAEWTAVYTLPGSELGDLDLLVTPTDAHTVWIFTEVETILS